MQKQRNNKSTFKIEDGRRLAMYVALYDEPAKVFDIKPGDKSRSYYTEVIKPGAFTKALKGSGEVIANIDHDANRTFARRSDNTLILQDDPKGLFASAWMPETELGDSILKDIDAGKIDGCSFRFVPIKERVVGEEVHVEEVKLEDVCVTATPAYQGTEVVHLRTANNTANLLLRLLKAKLRMVSIDTGIQIPTGEQ